LEGGDLQGINIVMDEHSPDNNKQKDTDNSDEI